MSKTIGYNRHHHYESVQDFDLWNQDLTVRIKDEIEAIVEIPSRHRECWPDVLDIFSELLEDIAICPGEYISTYQQVAKDFYKVAHMKSYIRVNGSFNTQNEQYMNDEEKQLASDIHALYEEIMNIDEVRID